ncbi:MULTISPECIES: DUF3221 domain-containing protein [Lysinibacillus]|uniref:DUF3221 domain-containing protein n=1 Tax=Lysinibacillus TaxID=400634 RepID=UPI00257E344E|nr:MULTISPECIES: DUF3221 domain-containing protein [Lysinibacillus]
MSKVDVTVIRDLSESKKRVMANVVQHIEQRDNKKRVWRWQYSVISVFFTACIVLFFYSQLQLDNKLLLSSNDLTILDEDEMSTMLNAYNPQSEQSRNELFQTMIEMDAYYAYALSKGIDINHKLEDKDRLMSKQNLEDGHFKKNLANLEMSVDEYFEKYIEPFNIKGSARNELLKDYQKRYENSFPLHAYLGVKKEAMDYLTAKYVDRISYLKKKYQFSLDPKDAYVSGTKYKTGYVVAIEGDRFLVVSGEVKDLIGYLSNEEMIDQKENGIWYPLHEVKEKIIVGNMVSVTYSMQERLGKYGFVANLDEIKIEK